MARRERAPGDAQLRPLRRARRPRRLGERRLPQARARRARSRVPRRRLGRAAGTPRGLGARHPARWQKQTKAKPGTRSRVARPAASARDDPGCSPGGRRGARHRDNDGGVPRDIGALGHVRRGADARRLGGARSGVRAVCIPSSSTGQANTRAAGSRGRGTTRRWTALAPAPGSAATAPCLAGRASPGGARGAGRRREPGLVRFRDGGDDAEAHARELDLNRGGSGNVAVRENVAPVPKERSRLVPRRAARRQRRRTRRGRRGRETPRATWGRRAGRRSTPRTLTARRTRRKKTTATARSRPGWSVARRGHTRTPAAFRGDAANEARGARLNHGVARACRNLEGGGFERG